MIARPHLQRADRRLLQDHALKGVDELLRVEFAAQSS